MQLCLEAKREIESSVAGRTPRNAPALFSVMQADGGEVMVVSLAESGTVCGCWFDLFGWPAGQLFGGRSNGKTHDLLLLGPSAERI